MKRFSLFIIVSILLFSCNSDDSETICNPTLVIESILFIELVNTEGENLIENGIYNPDDITIGFNGNIFTGVVFTGVQGVENVIVLNVFGEEGDNTFDINLSDTETDTLILNISKEEISDPCIQLVITVNEVIYNGESKELQDFEGGFLITVVKE
ncbi:hypothetical protein [uncultured Dokdonia sp.]|uniref:hypothetical protein n=1 Tax=uncultured Dokdonia sp. TaxID=575653 RepID=UPI002635D373|nr:hypothetical protein [uncultured Dokdonia sp.]